MINTATQDYVARLQADPNVVGIVLFGSWARSTHRPNSDVDLLVIVRHGFKRSVEYHDGQAFEIISTTEQDACAFWQSSPDEAVELWSVAEILFDRDGTMRRLEQVGKAIRERGKLPLEPEFYAHTVFDIRDQLRAVEACACTDPITARLLLSGKIVQLTELYFDIRQLWTPPPKQRLEVIRQRDREVYDLIAACYEEASLVRQISAAQSLFAAVLNQ
jgi:predicted nucleotidyltransferase